MAPKASAADVDDSSSSTDEDIRAFIRKERVALGLPPVPRPEVVAAVAVEAKQRSEASSSSSSMTPKPPPGPPPAHVLAAERKKKEEEKKEEEMKTWLQAVKASKSGGRSKGKKRMLGLYNSMMALKASGEWIGGEPNSEARDARKQAKCKAKPSDSASSKG